MERKSFKEFALLEMAFPVGKSSTDFQPKEGNYVSADIQQAFLKIGKRVGKGSSRIAIQVEVEPSQLESELPLDIVPNSNGKIDTVFKIALSAKGISQNQAEIRAFKTMKNKFKLILPILDYASNHTPIKVGTESFSHWV